MSEIRKQLSELQFRLMVDAQLIHDRATAALDAATRRQDEIRALVLEAHGVLGLPTQQLVLTADTHQLVLTVIDPPVPPVAELVPPPATPSA